MGRMRRTRGGGGAPIWIPIDTCATQADAANKTRLVNFVILFRVTR